ncbi:MAG: tol-pal system YbgF family protein [Gemmatimonadaceae bacterium]
MGIELPKVRNEIDGAIKVLDSYGKFPEFAQGRLLTPYFAYVLGRDTSYLATLRRWNGGDWIAAPSFQALAALDQRDTAKAIRIAAQFPRGDTAKIRAAPLGSMLDAFVEAEVLAAIGDLKGAAVTYESIDPTRARFSTFGFPDPRWPLCARSFLARGLLYEQLGEKSKAEAAYTKFLELWKEADPSLQPQLRLAREGLARLRDS